VVGRRRRLRGTVERGIGALRQELGPEPERPEGLDLVAVGGKDRVHAARQGHHAPGQRLHGIEVPEGAPPAAHQVPEGALAGAGRVPGAEHQVGRKAIGLPAEHQAAGLAEAPPPAEGVEDAGLVAQGPRGAGQGTLGAFGTGSTNHQDAHA
jgi:hypothetical protein